MLASAAGELATARNMLGATPKAERISPNSSALSPVAEVGSTRLILLMVFSFYLRGGRKLPVRRWQSSDRRQHHRCPSAVLRTVLAGSDVEALCESKVVLSVCPGPGCRRWCILSFSCQTAPRLKTRQAASRSAASAPSNSPQSTRNSAGPKAASTKAQWCGAFASS